MITEKLLDEELLDNEEIISSHDSAIYIDTEEYHISKPLPSFNPLWARILTGRGRKNQILLIRGKFYLTNYRIVFKAREEKSDIFLSTENSINLINSTKNRLHGKIDIFLWDIQLMKRFKSMMTRGLDIYTRNHGNYKFLISFANLEKIIKDFQSMTMKIDEQKVSNLIKFSNKVFRYSSNLMVNKRLEEQNKYWLKVNIIVLLIRRMRIPLAIIIAIIFFI
ncbi:MULTISPECIES: hypothetical protein [unclassified Moorena]|uniref:hypothetical protein n=1 Tax=unclassified Moorena TaxID=2683338 RepID=UPI0013BE1C98|nr:MULTISPECIES: hypothetical protein [unclassified Moorena]NEQ10450.1 hypothetical protein [Moorena sp. SIO4E2]NER90833.1 hypothetical protein [Moorena sp. SIO3A2]NET67358.1 hypothetical protein [Moorena sp. SIO1G6]